MPYKINQWVQWGDASYAEYIYEENQVPVKSTVEREISPLQNKVAIAYSNLLSAEYQLKNLKNNVVPKEQRLKFIASFLEKTIEILDEVRKEI